MAESKFVVDADADDRDAFLARLYDASLGMIDLVTVTMGDHLGLYRALADGGPANARELAGRTSTHPRYIREWLEQQAVTGILAVDDVEADAEARRYALSPGKAEVLLGSESLAFFAPIARLLIGSAAFLPEIEQAFRDGGGVSYSTLGAEVHDAIANANRPMFNQLLQREWFPAIPDVHARLQADPPARVADVGCGQGWSSLAIARAYPNATVDGLDLDAGSINRAQANAAAEGLSNRVRFAVRDAADPTLAGEYDVAIAFECIHDMSRPVDALRAMGNLVKDDGVVIVVDERTAEEFTAPGDEAERMLYGFSLLHCLPVGMAEQPSVGTGTVMRPATFRAYAQDAGFRDIEILPIENDSWRFYRLLR